jgi:Concanavalin A-like lectin/glucanases superfamily
MTTTLYFLVPIGLLAVAWSLCFVGCGLPTSGESQPYSDGIVGSTGLVAYWPLSDLLAPLNVKGQTAGTSDISGNNHNGTYTIPPLYPAPTAATPSDQPPSPLSLTRDTSIVIGDTGSKKNPFPGSVNFQGGFVNIAWAANSPQLNEFTVEAWIKPSWTVQGFNWVLFGALAPGDATGFNIYVNTKNNWEFVLGNGTAANPPIDSGVPAPVNPSQTTYVAVTFNASTPGSTTGTLALWINPSSDTQAAPTPVFSMTTTYAAADPGQLGAIFIGAGDNEQAQSLRAQDMGPGAPLFPFLGQIQSVALYSIGLDPETLAGNFSNGATTS